MDITRSEHCDHSNHEPEICPRIITGLQNNNEDRTNVLASLRLI